ncbi:MAG: hypothetical protein AAB871_01445 [Patescibacteria group bacterium]
MTATGVMRKKEPIIKDKAAKSELLKYIALWQKEFWNGSREEIFEQFKY